MSSTNKTDNLGLNAWLGSDVPQMEDFNRDNVIVDAAIGNHSSNGDMHITNAEREKWNHVYALSTYYGNGTANRTIALNCGFTPSWGIIFGTNKLASVTDFKNTSDYNYFAIVTKSGAMQGVSLSGTQLTVQQSSVSVLGYEYKNFNEAGVTYVCIMFA